MKQRGECVDAILAFLRANPESTTGEIAQALGMTKGAVSATLRRLRRTYVGIPKRVYIADYTYGDSLHGRRYPRPMYCVGDKECAKKPKVTIREVRERHRVARFRAASVFDLGKNLRDREIERGKKRRALSAGTTAEESTGRQVA